MHTAYISENRGRDQACQVERKTPLSLARAMRVAFPCFDYGYVRDRLWGALLVHFGCSSGAECLALHRHHRLHGATQVHFIEPKDCIEPIDAMDGQA